MARAPKTFVLTSQLVAANAGSPVVCIAASAIGQTFRLHAKRPGADTNRRYLQRSADGLSPSADIVKPDGTIDLSPQEEEVPALIEVHVSGPIEQRAGYHDPCAGWSDGHDAIAERMVEALEQSDVLMVFDSPGGAHAGLQEAVRRVQEAKEIYGRRVTGFVDELCGSAAFWWAACVCDEIYAPESGIIGSIGARAAHASMAGALEQEGVAVTFFAWPGPGKTAFAPELPLSDIGRERGDRDVSLAGEAFAAAVGPRRGMSRDDIVALDADALSGDMAVNARLIDGVATYEEVVEYCIMRNSGVKEDSGTSESGELAKMTLPKNKIVASAVAPALRAEDDDKEKKDGDKPEEGAGMEPDGVCKACGHNNEMNAKYCDQCGDSMEAKPLESEDDEPEKEESSDEPDGKEKPGANRAATPAPEKDERASASMNAILGLRPNASALAQKTAVLRMKDTLTQCMAQTGTTSPDALLGAVIAHAGDARRVSQLEETNRAMVKRETYRERVQLLNKLAAGKVQGCSRGELFVDMVNDAGERTGVRPAKMFAEMKIGTLREYVSSKLKNSAAGARTTPFDTTPETARSAADARPAVDAASSEIVKGIATRTSASSEQIAATYAALFGVPA